MSQPMSSHKSSSLSGNIKVPGDKSISHRALLFGALAIGETRISGLLEAEDILATAKAVHALGADVEKVGDEWVVLGRGVGGFKKPSSSIDFGNSGTGSRLMMGALAGHDFEVELIGDESLSKRPMGRILKPLSQMGLSLGDPEEDKLPLKLTGTDQLIPMDYVLPMPSAQVKSAVLIAGLHASGKTSVTEPEATRDHTERMLSYFGAKLDFSEVSEGRVITIEGDAELSGKPIVVPGDPSSAAFLTAAAILCPGSDLTIQGILTNPTRFGFYQTLIQMGANIEIVNQRDEGGEPVADIRVKHSQLKGVSVPPERAPSMIDEYPCLAVVASFATGETRMNGLAELRVKECDRLTITYEGLKKCGVNASIEGDDLIVQGSSSVNGGAVVETELDHRIAMSFLVMGLASEQPITVDDISMIKTSFPEFLSLMADIGAKFNDV